MNFDGLKGRIPVEPLDDERLTNIERRIVSGADATVARPLRTPRFGLATGMAFAAVVAVGAGFAGWQLRGARPAAPVVAELPVHVRTDTQRSSLDIGDAVLTTDAATELTITRPNGGVLVTMKRGKVELEVGKRGDRAPLVVAAGDTQVIVVGTRFSVDYGDGTGVAEVRVTEGVVRVERHQQDVRVTAGQAWTAKRGVIALAQLPEVRRPGGGTIVASADAARPTGTPGEPGATIDDPETGSSAIEIEIETGEAPDILRDRIAVVPDARVRTGPTATPTTGSGGTRPTTTDGPAIVRPSGSTTGNTGTSGAPRGKLPTLIKNHGVVAALDVGVDDKHLMARYQVLVRERGDQEAHAFYSMAFTQHFKLGRNGDALSTLDAYLRRFPKSEYHDAALWLRVRVQCLAFGIDDKCRFAAAEYLRRAPDGRARAIAELITLSR
ncbi:MAG: FecR domain-containing protein [Deltaproteobacteria bacterium]|nr:FecR domain-containing protein [Deltaproteobacteria bacterium]MDQ3300736.1 FecR family protein [Myxococcota bacterium]